MSKLTKKRIFIAGAIAFVAAAATTAVATLAGCDIQACSEVQDDYEQAVTRESGLVALDDDGPPHLAMALRLDFVNELTSAVLERAIGDAVSAGGSIDVSGESVGFSLGSTGASVQLEASDACDGCLRVFGDFDGDAEVELPLVGTQSSPLRGSLDLVIPLDVGRDGDDVAVFLDTSEAARLGMSSVDTRLTGLSDTWSGPVASALSAELADSLAERLDPVRLVGYELPDLGLGGLEITPSLFVLDEASNALILGVRTNTDVGAQSHSDDRFVQALSLDDGQNVALGIQPGFAVEAVRLGLREERVPRRYSLTGNARDDGPAYAVVDRFDAGPHDSVADAVGLGLDFRVFNFQSSLGCFSMDGLAKSRLQITDGEIELDVEDVDFSGGSGISDVANWASAEFVQNSHSVLRSSVDDGVISSSGLGVSMRGDRVSTEAGLLVLRGLGSAD